MRATIGVLGRVEPDDLSPEAQDEIVGLFLRYREESGEG
jgi:hypothetical protein